MELPAPYANDEEKDFAVSLDFLGEDTCKVTDAGMSRLLCATVRRVLLTGVLQ